MDIALDTEDREVWSDAYDAYDYEAAAVFKRKAVAAFKKKHGFGKYFKLIDSYKETEYFNEVIQQCVSYKLYSAR